ncbi:NUDIX hydrolase [Pseudorhodobacter aquimaris]|uniref:NUDIX hydrolase n=1 Tax=Pseudorhodobacter aquimaris TaxID=687412 RepID=UPI00067E5171|nr:NUDIX hydrolase [Pseudorhodobacter aquimaris]
MDLPIVTEAVIDKTALRHAATVVLWRAGAGGAPEVLMGQRGAKAAFMPSKYVFPGGAVDPADAFVDLANGLPMACAARLNLDADIRPEILAAAAIRELWEETGLALGVQGNWTSPPADVDHDWAGFAARGLIPSAQEMQFIFRAITPPGRPRRFDARFFLVPATQVAGDVDDFSAASDELSHLHWIALAKTRQLDLPFITEVVLAEVASVLQNGPNTAGVPFFDNSGNRPQFRRLA